MRTRGEIDEAIDVLSCQAAILESEGQGDGLACNCCWASIAMLRWATGDVNLANEQTANQLKIWAERARAEGPGRFQRPAVQ